MNLPDTTESRVAVEACYDLPMEKGAGEQDCYRSLGDRRGTPAKEAHRDARGYALPGKPRWNASGHAPPGVDWKALEAEPTLNMQIMNFVGEC